MSVSPARGVSPLEPDTLTHLVGGRLPGPPEVAVDLVPAVHRVTERPGHQEFQAEFRRPGLPLVEAGTGRDRQLQVHSDVEHYPRRPEKLGVEHSEQVAVVGEVPRFTDQPFGIEGPALGVTRGVGKQSLVLIELVSLEYCGGELEMMS